MTHTEATITSTKACSHCHHKMSHGHKAIALTNAKGKVKAYCCSDQCAKACSPPVGGFQQIRSDNVILAA